MTRVWLVTGASTGFGRAIAELAVARGDTVVATARDPRTVADFPDHEQLDVTDTASVDRAVAATVERHGRIDVLVNNAGHGLIGAVEELSDDDLRGLLDTNVVGVLRATRAVLPHMRAQQAGTIVQLSSVGGVIGNPGHAAYATSKFALEGLSEALSGEVAPWGIRVLLVEPGPFRTDFAGRSIHAAEPIDAYTDTPAGRLRQNFRNQDGKQPNDPRIGAQLIVDAVDSDSPPLRLPLGPEAIGRIRDTLADRQKELESWAEIGVATRFA
ncbi:SDR family NAD(P)-dependent oxidoreductase [Pseudonocardia phyllosphaerae]|uniref:SDR family NAD(P)-dependent oxidoreductase n=1 Tax=Pseudonocardia phyllosphaerae TaxID=3390502 RepID=UPI00397882DD